MRLTSDERSPCVEHESSTAPESREPVAEWLLVHLLIIVVAVGRKNAGNPPAIAAGLPVYLPILVLVVEPPGDFLVQPDGSAFRPALPQLQPAPLPKLIEFSSLLLKLSCGLQG